MGLSFSNNRRRHNNYYHPHHHHPPLPAPPPPPYYYSTESLSLPPPPPPPPPPQNYYSTTTTANTTHRPTYPYQGQSYYNTGPHNSYGNYMVGSLNYHQPYYSNGWGPVGTNVGPSSQVVNPAPYVENAKKVRNDVNVHKDSLRLVVDEENHDLHLVSFVFDAVFDGSITIFYFAKEEADCKIVPVFPEAHVPVRIPFQKGFAQKFCQPSGTGVDLGFFELDDLSKPSPEGDTFPLVIVAESCSSDHLKDGYVDDSVSNTSKNMQITQAVIDKKDNEPFKVRTIKQILWIDGERYELRDLYGIGSSAAENFDDGDPGKECVICMTEPKDTAVLPCRHMCMCSECAKALRLQSNKCPICRQPIEELMEIRINGSDH